MEVWLSIILLSIFIGLVCSVYIPGKLGMACSGAIPWFCLLAWLLYQEYFVPYKGGGASMWPIAQLFGGTVAAVTGMVTCKLYKLFTVK